MNIDPKSLPKPAKFVEREPGDDLIDQTENVQPGSSLKVISEADKRLDKIEERFKDMGKFFMGQIDTLNKKIDEIPKVIDEIDKVDGEIPLNGFFEKFSFFPQHSPRIDKLVAAVTKSFSDMAPVEKSGQGNRGSYVKIEDLMDAAAPAFEKNKVMIGFFPWSDHNKKQLVTMIIAHEDQWIKTTSYVHEDQRAPNSNPDWHQRLMAADTYIRRMMLRGVLNVTSDSEK